MKKIALTLSLVLIHLLFATEPRLVKVGAFNYYPGIFLDKDGVVKGFYVEALAEIAAKENIRFEYIFGSWNEGLERIKSGEVDLLTSVAYTEERALFLDYCKNPLLTVWGELYAPNSSELDDVLEVNGKKIGVMKNDFNGKSFIDLTKKFGLECNFIEFGDFEEVFLAIAQNKVDAGVANVTFGAAKQMEYKLRSTGVVFNPFDIFFATAKDKNSDLIALLDKYLAEWRHQENSVYNQARQKWSHGAAGIITVMPGWLNEMLMILGIVIAVGLFFIFLLKLQVKKATAAIIEREKELKESEEKFRSLVWDMQVGVLLQGSQSEIIMSNPRALELLGLTESQLLGKSSFDPDWNVIHEDGTPYPGTEHPVPQAIATLQPVRNVVMGVYRPTTEDRVWILVDALPQLNIDGTIRQVVCTFIDITERKLLEDTQSFLLHSGYINSTECFFDQVARFLADKLDMDFVCIDKLSGDMLSAKTVSVFFDDKFEDNIEYTLHDTPCGEVAGKTICTFEAGVRHLFPKDQVLQDMKAESYLGITLFDSREKAIGLIAVIGRKPLKNQKLAAEILKQVAVRAAWELERLAAEEALKDSEDIFNQFMEHCPVYVFFKDENIRLLKLSKNFTEWLGKPMEDLLGKNMDELFPSDFAKKIVDDDRRILAEGKVVVLEEEFKGRTYSTIKFPFKTVNQKKYLAGFTIDITERKQFSDDLKKQNLLIQTMFDNLPIGIFMVKAEGGIPLMANEVAKELLGRGVLPDVSKNNLNIIYQAYKSSTKELYPLDEMPIIMGMHGKFSHIDDMEVERPDGERRLLEVFGCPVFDADHQVWASLVGFFDITERKAIESKLKEQAADLKENNRELSIFNKSAISRELRMIELKKEINELRIKTGQPEKYPLDFAE